MYLRESFSATLVSLALFASSVFEQEPAENSQVDSIDIDSPIYIKPFISYQFSDSFLLRLEYTNFQEKQSFENALTLNLSFL